jgi:PqqD family protein of HPr-rel-A system
MSQSSSSSGSSTLKNLAISETGFVFDPRSGATYTLNTTGQAVVLALRDGQSIDAIVERLRGTYEGGGDRVREDVLDFVQSLRRSGLVPADFTA